MGYYTRSDTIRCFSPDDREDAFFQESPATMNTIMEKAREHFGNDITVDMLRIDAEYIHTDCLGYDQYDPGDYTLYLCISKL